ncbi:MAG TPA: ABC transporter ATP-binding protein, partial [Bacteroidia bacterium]|nr:ABC transporter ATP-binding protein [Bacteroidia bacterium]
FYVLLPLPILVFIIYKVHDIINKKSDKVQSQLSTMSTFVQESFSGIRVLKAFAREKEFENAFDKQCADYKNASMELARVNAFFFPSITLLIGVSSIITIYVGGLAVINNQLTVGNIAEFVIYVNMLTWPVASLGWIITLIQRAAASQQRINEFLSIPISIKSSTNDDKTIDGKIAFNNVSFTYSNSGITALRNISFVARPGECIAFIGKTGSGKSTIANLLLRMYDTANGEILIDDKNITQHNLQNIREQIGYVPQEVFLFSDTIKHNILFGIKDTTNEKSLHEKMLASAHDAAIYDNIINFNDGFETMLGERGINLSGGQKQRVSIARAIVKEPRILIFDDCLSAVDTETEETILQNLQRIMKDKTTVIISHRVSSVKTADTIYVLDDGKIMEHGSHHQLIEANGIYKTMYDTQTNREKLQAQLAE